MILNLYAFKDQNRLYEEPIKIPGSFIKCLGCSKHATGVYKAVVISAVKSPRSGIFRDPAFRGQDVVGKVRKRT